MTEPTTEKEWADYLCDVVRRLDTLPVQNWKHAPSLQQYVDEASEALAGLIGYLVGAESRNGPDAAPLLDKRRIVEVLRKTSKKN